MTNTEHISSEISLISLEQQFMFNFLGEGNLSRLIGLVRQASGHRSFTFKPKKKTQKAFILTLANTIRKKKKPNLNITSFISPTSLTSSNYHSYACDDSDTLKKMSVISNVCIYNIFL